MSVCHQHPSQEMTITGMEIICRHLPLPLPLPQVTASLHTNLGLGYLQISIKSLLVSTALTVPSLCDVASGHWKICMLIINSASTDFVIVVSI